MLFLYESIDDATTITGTLTHTVPQKFDYDPSKNNHYNYDYN